MNVQPFYLSWTRDDGRDEVKAFLRLTDAVLDQFIRGRTPVSIRGIGTEDWASLRQAQEASNGGGAIFLVDGRIGDPIPALDDPGVSAQELDQAAVGMRSGQAGNPSLHAVLSDGPKGAWAIMALHDRGLLENMMRMFRLAPAEFPDAATFVDNVVSACRERGQRICICAIDPVKLGVRSIPFSAMVNDRTEDTLKEIRDHGLKITTILPLQERMTDAAETGRFEIEDPIEFPRI